MKTIRSQHFARVLVGLLTFLGWIILSNHCALAGMLGEMRQPVHKAGESACCQKKSSIPEDKPPCQQMPHGCCKTLKIVKPDGAKLPDVAQGDIAKTPLDLPFTVFISLPKKISAAPETGPPSDSPTFAELVLQRSLLSHAPPVRA